MLVPRKGSQAQIVRVQNTHTTQAHHKIHKTAAAPAASPIPRNHPQHFNIAEGEEDAPAKIVSDAHYDLERIFEEGVNQSPSL